MKDAEPPRWNKDSICFQSVEPSVRREHRDKRHHRLTCGVRAKLVLWETERRKGAEGRTSFKKLTTKGYGLYETGSDFCQSPGLPAPPWSLWQIKSRRVGHRPPLVWTCLSSSYTPQETITIDCKIFFLFSRTLKSTPMNPSYKWILWTQS